MLRVSIEAWRIVEPKVESVDLIVVKHQGLCWNLEHSLSWTNRSRLMHHGHTYDTLDIQGTTTTSSTITDTTTMVARPLGVIEISDVIWGLRRIVWRQICEWNRIRTTGRHWRSNNNWRSWFLTKPLIMTSCPRSTSFNFNDGN